MKIFQVLLAASCWVSFTVAEESDLSGTYAGNGLTFAFVKGMKVDVTGAVPAVAQLRSGQIVQRSESTITIRCDYEIFSPKKLDEFRAFVAKQNNDKKLMEVLDKYSVESGYARWILIKDRPEIATFLAQSDGALVDVLTSRVYKRPWYSR